MTPEKKCELGSAESGSLIRELLEDFLFPASKLMLHLNKTGQLAEDPAIPICDTPQTQAAAFDLLISLCLNCVQNYKQLVAMLTEMFYNGNCSCKLSLCDLYKLFLLIHRSEHGDNRVGLFAGGRAPPLSGLRGSEERRRHLLHELGTSATLHGGKYSRGCSGGRRGRHRPPRRLHR